MHGGRRDPSRLAALSRPGRPRRGAVRARRGTLADARTSRRARRAARLSRLGPHFGFREHALDLVLERAAVGGELVPRRARPLEQVAIAAEVGEAKVRKPRLPCAEQGAAAAQLEVDLCELEAVARLAKRLQPGVRRLRQLLFRARDEHAVRLLGAATDAT